MNATAITTEQLQEKSQLWQQRLRLSDWDVKADIVPRRNMSKPDACGECSWDLCEKVAHIKVVELEDYPSFALRPYDAEEILVHELLHLHIAPFNAEYEPEQTAQEQMINAIASALVKLARENNNG